MNKYVYVCILYIYIDIYISTYLIGRPLDHLHSRNVESASNGHLYRTVWPSVAVRLGLLHRLLGHVFDVRRQERVHAVDRHLEGEEWLYYVYIFICIYIYIYIYIYILYIYIYMYVYISAVCLGLLHHLLGHVLYVGGEKRVHAVDGNLEGEY